MAQVARPTRYKVLRGDRADRINRNEPQPPDLPAVKPPWLSPFASEEWDAIVPDLDAMGVTKRADSNAIAAYCEAVARFRVATSLVTRAGPLIKNAEGNLVKNPAVAQARDASHELRLWSKELGLTPSARTPLRIEHVGQSQPGAELLSG